MNIPVPSAAPMKDIPRRDEPHQRSAAMENESLGMAKVCPRSPFMTTKQAALYLCLAPQTLDKMRVMATGPRYRKHGRYVRYHIDELNAWSEGRGHLSTSYEGAK